MRFMQRDMRETQNSFRMARRAREKRGRKEHDRRRQKKMLTAADLSVLEVGADGDALIVAAWPLAQEETRIG